MNSAGAVAEDDYTNNVGAALRPPGGLVADVHIAWDLPAGQASVSWTFGGAIRALPDLGFRVSIPGFGILEVPAGTRAIVVPFAPFTALKPCSATVAARNAEGYYWPGVASNTLCGVAK